MKVIPLDSRRNPHPKRAERLKATPPAPHQEMQSLMRQAHQNQNIRAAVVARARKHEPYTMTAERNFLLERLLERVQELRQQCTDQETPALAGKCRTVKAPGG